jgi:hypothetical protein
VNTLSSAENKKIITRGNHSGSSKSTPQILPHNEEILLSEDFESGELPSDPWEIVITNTTVDTLAPDTLEVHYWFVAIDDQEFINGSYIAWVNYDIDDPSDEWIITPEIDLEGVEDPRLYFSRFYGIPDPWSEKATLHVRLSKDNGVTFPDTIYSITPSSIPGVEHVELSLMNYMDEQVKIGFQYAGMDGDSVGLDNIIVTDGEFTDIQVMSLGTFKNSLRKK